MDGGNGKNAIVYNTKKRKKWGGGGDGKKDVGKRKRKKNGKRVGEIQQQKGRI